MAIGEIHPAAHSAMAYVKIYLSANAENSFLMQEAMASCAIEGNRLAGICGETLRRVMAGEAVSDRYILGLAWYLKEMNWEEDES